MTLVAYREDGNVVQANVQAAKCTLQRESLMESWCHCRVIPCLGAAMPERCELEAGGSHGVLTPLGETSREYGGTPLRAWGPRWGHSRAGGFVLQSSSASPDQDAGCILPSALLGKLP